MSLLFFDGDNDLLVNTAAPLNYSRADFRHEPHEVFMPTAALSLGHAREGELRKAELHQGLVAVEGGLQGVHIGALFSAQIHVIGLPVRVDDDVLIAPVPGHREVFYHVQVVLCQHVAVVLPVGITHLLLHDVREFKELLDVDEDSGVTYRTHGKKMCLGFLAAARLRRHRCRKI